mmetsp:Transcript_24818/g.42502  ORF Transcript_24818/g.42502 Transcript_24818/m.42502 type:complete len:223 (-) Transcript_24818:377-1045(-)
MFRKGDLPHDCIGSVAASKMFSSLPLDTCRRQRIVINKFFFQETLITNGLEQNIGWIHIIGSVTLVMPPTLSMTPGAASRATNHHFERKGLCGLAAKLRHEVSTFLFFAVIIVKLAMRQFFEQSRLDRCCQPFLCRFNSSLHEVDFQHRILDGISFLIGVFLILMITTFATFFSYRCIGWPPFILPLPSFFRLVYCLLVANESDQPCFIISFRDSGYWICVF